MRTVIVLALLAACSSDSDRDTVRVRIVLPDMTEEGSSGLAIDHFDVWKRGQGRVGGASGGAEEFRIYADDTADLAVKAFDASGKLVACGQSPPVPSVDDVIAIYVAPPLSVTKSPGKRSDARWRVGAAAVSQGLILVGGSDGTNGPIDVIDFYNIYTHEVTVAPLGFAREGISVAVEPIDGGDRVWLVSGSGPTMDGHVAHVDVAADGTIGTTIFDGDFPGVGTIFAPAFATAPGEWIIPGYTPLLLRAGTLTARPDLGNLYDRAAKSPTLNRVAFDAGAWDLAVIEGDSVKHLRLPRVMDTVVGLTRGRFLAIHDGRDGYVVDPDAGTIVDTPGLRMPGVDLQIDAIGTNGRQVVIVDTAGAEVFDAETLERFDDVLALGNYQRIGVRLPNDQIAFIDEGRDTIHLFTPPPPEWADSVAMAGVRN